MLRIWGKIYKNEKVIKHASYEVDPKACSFFDLIRGISEKLDIPTPIILEKHLSDFNEFNMCVFRSDDFVHPVNFSRFVIENISSDD